MWTVSVAIKDLCTGVEGILCPPNWVFETLDFGVLNSFFGALGPESLALIGFGTASMTAEPDSTSR